MHKQRLTSVSWHVFRALLGLMTWLYVAPQLMKTNDLAGWIMRAGFGLILVGGLANVVVVILNRGVMPVRLNRIRGRKRLAYEPIHRRTRLWFLGDCIRLGAYYLSPGDLLLCCGIAMTIIAVTLARLLL